MFSKKIKYIFFFSLFISTVFNNKCLCSLRTNYNASEINYIIRSLERDEFKNNFLLIDMLNDEMQKNQQNLEKLLSAISNSNLITSLELKYDKSFFDYINPFNQTSNSWSPITYSDSLKIIADFISNYKKLKHLTLEVTLINDTSLMQSIDYLREKINIATNIERIDVAIKTSFSDLFTPSDLEFDHALDESIDQLFEAINNINNQERP